MPIHKKVAIIYKGKDIGRVIPFQPNEDGDCDFTLSFLKNEYYIQIYKLLMTEPYYYMADEDLRDWEITYHRHTQTQPTKIHSKRINEQGKKIYNPLGLDRLRDPTIHSEFPIPLFRIQIPKVDTYKDYEQNSKKHIVVDLEDCNIAEFFLVPANFDYTKFSDKWPMLSHHFWSASFQSYAATGLIIDDQKQYSQQKPSISVSINANLGLIINRFRDERVELEGAQYKTYDLYDNPETSEMVENELVAIPQARMEELISLFRDKLINNSFCKLPDGLLEVTFIENELSDATLCLSTCAYSGENERIGKLRYMFEEDLSRGNRTKEERVFWIGEFTRMKKQLDMEIETKYIKGFKG